MTPRIMAEDFSRLLTISKSDLLVAKTLLEARAPGIRQEEICLHCHAAAEKALKAVAYLTGYEPPRTHRIRILIEHIESNSGMKVPVASQDPESFAFLDAYSSVARYEDLLPKADYTVAESAYVLVERLVSAIESKYVQA